MNYFLCHSRAGVHGDNEGCCNEAEEAEEEDITDMTVKQWGVYVDPETGKIVSKDIQ